MRALSAKPRRERPIVISTYLSPSAERGRTISVESAGSGRSPGSSSSSSTALTEPFSCVRVEIPLTTPARAPPMRTSLPRTSPAAFGTSASSG